MTQLFSIDMGDLINFLLWLPRTTILLISASKVVKGVLEVEMNE
jgi:hypothetical protein